MEDFELLVEGERFRVSERLSDDGAPGYDFIWLNGPGEGSYGFSLGLARLGVNAVDGAVSNGLSPAQLREQARDFVESFYQPGGIRDEDFHDHIAARIRQKGAQN